MFVPGEETPVLGARALRLDTAETLVDGPVPHVADAAGSARLAIDEGCPCFCAFCAESWDRKPYRTRSADTLVRLAREIKAAGAVEALEIFSMSFSSHPELHRILAALAPRFHRLGLKSQRLDVLAHDPAAAASQHALGKSNLTCGIEGISAHLRRRLHKSLGEDEIREGLAALLRARPR